MDTVGLSLHYNADVFFKLLETEWLAIFTHGKGIQN